MKTNNLKLCQIIPLIIVLQILLTFQVHAGDYTGHKGFTIGFQSGYGRLTLGSDQKADRTRGTYSMVFQGGYSVNPYLIVGLEIGGWLLQGYNLRDWATGESISNTMITLHVFPIKRRLFYLRAAIGHTSYTNHRTGGAAGGGWGSYLIGGGYEIRLSRQLFIGPQFGYSRGHISDVPSVLGRETGRRYKVTDISAVLHWYNKK